jgi:ribosomal protein S18 acetylase RimI-like enzyme
VDPALWFVASDGDEPVGVALCSVDEGRGYVETLGVRPAWQGRGIGGALLRSAFAAFAERGLLDVDLGVDSENPTGAVGLYERAGMRATRRYDVFERRLTGSGASRAAASTA